ncbi:hypothetical protein [Shewanella salipaludis]|uniref:Uncharacterized protein n=1 Tax=Shewanella salipaludis TaxID=2723052 RepID=A0A972FRQ7_9GAMM|nr:hypothetical protein [Shewanella salipaludis]NMH64968.1 hypothetical protein [Shewanella salipaludis]
MPFKSNMKELAKLKKNLESLGNTHEVGLSEIMTPEFISGCSAFSGLNELFSASGFKVESAKDFKAIPDDEWEYFIINNTTFDSWVDMQKSALDKYTKSEINEGLKKG